MPESKEPLAKFMFLVEFSNLTFETIAGGRRDSNVKFIPLGHTGSRNDGRRLRCPFILIPLRFVPDRVSGADLFQNDGTKRFVFRCETFRALILKVDLFCGRSKIMTMFENVRFLLFDFYDRRRCLKV